MRKFCAMLDADFNNQKTCLGPYRVCMFFNSHLDQTLDIPNLALSCPLNIFPIIISQSAIYTMRDEDPQAQASSLTFLMLRMSERQEFFVGASSSHPTESCNPQYSTDYANSVPWSMLSPTRQETASPTTQ